MKRKHPALTAISRILGISYAILLLFMIAFLFGQVGAQRNTLSYFPIDSPRTTVSGFTCSVNGYDRNDITLPTTIIGLSPGDRVVLSTAIPRSTQNNLLLKSVNTRVELYLNNDANWSYSVGWEGTYPSFQREPPVAVTMIGLPETAEMVDIRLEYTISPLADSLDLPAIYTGDRVYLLDELLKNAAAPLVLSFVVLIAGIALAIVGLGLMRKVPVAKGLIWLGLTCFATGLWTICGNDLSLYFVPGQSVLYTLSYLGLFALPVTIVPFGITMLQPSLRWPLSGLFAFNCIAFFAALSLHVTGILPFAVSADYVLILSALTLTVFVFVLFIEYFRNQNPVAAQFGIAFIILTVFAGLEFFNQIVPLVTTQGLLFQIGVALAVLVLAVLAWQYVSEAFDAAEKNVKLEAEMAASARSLDLQRTLYETLSRSTEEVRTIRHDLRHQLSAVKGFLEDNDNAGAKEYIDRLYGSIPSIGDKLLCDNFAVNALVVHYLALAEADGIQTDLRLVVPREVGGVPDTDLCVIIGNLFENAIEACRFVEPNKRFIKLQTSVVRQRFMVVMDNSFDGKLRVQGGNFYSRKREGKGIGMASVKTEVSKYDGSMKYEATSGIFKTSLYIKIKDPKQ